VNLQIILYYQKNISYKDGFINYNNKENKYRGDVKFVINGEHTNKLGRTEELNIREGDKLELHFTDNITSLQSFFDKNSDPNTIYIYNISFGNFFASSVTRMDYLFYGCNSLISVDFYNFNSSLVTKMNNLFNGCKSLKYVDFSSFDTSQVTTMESMLSGCNSLEYIDLTMFETSSVKSMNSLFSSCQNLKVIDLWNFNTENVIYMKSMFINCYSLKILDISSFNMINVENAGNMFSKLKNLTYINLYNVINSKDYIKESYLKEIRNLTVCQKKKNCRK